MLAAMPLSLFYEWQEYYNKEPFGEERADVRSAIIAQTVANRHRGKGESPHKLDAFMPNYGGKEVKRQSFKEIECNLMQIIQMHNKKWETKDRNKHRNPSN